MDLLKRFGYYFVGLSLGMIAVFFFWKKKNVRFDYLPNARTLKNIRIKKRLYSDEAKTVMKTKQIDSLMIATILNIGEVDFSKSKTNTTPCREYFVSSEILQKQISLVIKNCDSTATISKVIVN